ncbi:ferrous iron transport protein A [Kitasatospora sp. NPDC054939]
MVDDLPPGTSNTADRRAVEQVLGRPLESVWPTDALAPRSRVTVIREAEWDGPWPVEFPGTVDDTGAPEPVEHPRAQDGELVYRVVFDHPQYDSDGCGPYRKAQIWSRHLRPRHPTA